MKMPETDAEVVELCRKEMQAVIDRTDWSAPRKELIASVGLPHQAVQFIAADLTEIGTFEVDLPPEATVGYHPVVAKGLRRHWVYRHKDGRVLSLQLRQRLMLRQLGFMRSHGFVNDVFGRN